MDENLKAPFPYFGGKSKAAGLVWQLMGGIKNYVEPFAGSAAILLSRPDGAQGIETINDFDCMVSNFWRAIAADPEAVAGWADNPVSEIDLFARHSWLVREKAELRDRMTDPDFYDAKIAGWWVWGACAWIGPGWCSGKGPWVWDGSAIVDKRKLPHLSGGQGINRTLPHLSGGQGINRQLPHLSGGRGEFIASWFASLHERLRDVRVACGDWQRVLGDSVTIKNGVTGIFLDPPYERGNMDYGDGGMGRGIAGDVMAWCMAHGDAPKMRILLCGHAGDYPSLAAAGWTTHEWKAGNGYSRGKEKNYKLETIWASPHCVAVEEQMDLAA